MRQAPNTLAGLVRNLTTAATAERTAALIAIHEAAERPVQQEVARAPLPGRLLDGGQPAQFVPPRQATFTHPRPIDDRHEALINFVFARMQLPDNGIRSIANSISQAAALRPLLRALIEQNANIRNFGIQDTGSVFIFNLPDDDRFQKIFREGIIEWIRGYIAVYQRNSANPNQFSIFSLAFTSTNHRGGLNMPMLRKQPGYRIASLLDLNTVLRRHVEHRLAQHEKYQAAGHELGNVQETEGDGTIIFQGFHLNFLEAATPTEISLERLKAYKRIADKKFLKLSMLSVKPDSMICIYTTFYVAYILQKDDIKKFKKKYIPARSYTIELALSREPLDIQQAVREGHLVTALQLLCYKYKVPYFDVKFYETGDVYEFPSLKNLGNKVRVRDRGGLYSINAEHIAPYVHKTPKPKPNKRGANVILNPDTEAKILLEDKEAVPTMTIKAKDAKNTDSDPFVLCAVDIETYTDKHMKPYALCYKMGNQPAKAFYGFDCADRFVNDVIFELAKDSFVKKKKDKISKAEMARRGIKPKKPLEYHFYAHNGGGFDFIYLYQAIIRCGFIPEFIMPGTKIIMLRVGNVTFVDSLKLLPGTLRQLCIIYGVEQVKTYFPYLFPTEANIEAGYCGSVPGEEFWVNPEERHLYLNMSGGENAIFDLKKVTIDYCLRDVEVLWEIMNKYLKSCVGTIGDRVFDTRLCISASAAALELFKQAFIKEGLIYYCTSLASQKALREAYKGGAVCHFKKFSNKKCVYLDINSSYPSVMTMKYPIATLLSYIIEMGEEIPIECFQDVYLYRCRIIYPADSFEKPSCPNILVRDANGNLRNPIDQSDMYRWVWGVELVLAVKAGAKVVYNAHIPFNSGYVFKEFAEYLYGERLVVKEKVAKLTAEKVQLLAEQKKLEKVEPRNGEIENALKENLKKLAENIASFEGEANTKKLWMNGLYGKMGQNRFKHAFIEYLETFNNTLRDHIMDDIAYCYVPSLEVFVGEYTDSVRDNAGSIGNFIHWASYTTALGRCKLFEMIYLIGVENIVYCDTDSVIYETSDEIEVKVAPFIDQKKLGYWKNEMGESQFITDVMCAGPKMYCYKKPNGEYVYHLKGVPVAKVNDPEIFRKLIIGESWTFKDLTQWKRSVDLNEECCVEIVDTMKIIRENCEKREFMADGSRSRAMGRLEGSKL
jgi:hypothetical protein